MAFCKHCTFPSMSVEKRQVREQTQELDLHYSEPLGSISLRHGIQRDCASSMNRRLML